MKLGELNVIEFSGVQVVEEPCPIDTGNHEVVLIRGLTPGTYVELVSTEEMQPCIGGHTHTGMSYGRFTIHSARLKTIIIDGCTVVCRGHGRNEAFTIGDYGSANVPFIHCINGGSLDCPETRGKRYMCDCIDRYEGSSKMTGYAQYVICADGESPDVYIPADRMEYIDSIIKKAPHMKGQLGFVYSVRALKALDKTTSLVEVQDSTPWLKPGNAMYYASLHACALIGMPMSMADAVEFFWESQKLDYLYWRYCVKESITDKDVECVKLTALMILYELSNISGGNKDRITEMCYEMIPAFMHDFSGKAHNEEVLIYLDNNINGNIETWYEFGLLQSSAVRNRLADLNKKMQGDGKPSRIIRL